MRFKILANAYKRILLKCGYICIIINGLVLKYYTCIETLKNAYVEIHNFSP